MKKAAWFTLALTLSGGLVFGQQSNFKFSSELQNVDPRANVDVIVQFDQVPTAAHHQKVLSRGGQLRQTLNVVKAGAYQMPASAIADLANDPSVVHISMDHKLGAKDDYTSAAINASVASQQYNATGTGVGVVVIDSGITGGLNDLKGLSGQSRIGFQDFLGGNGADLYGHGTHVAGIIAGNGKNSTCGNCTRTIAGLAPNVQLINLRVLDQNGLGTDSNVIAAIDLAIQVQQTYNIRVINLSLGRAVFESYKVDPLCQAVEAAWKAGIVVVVAAGNEGRDNSVGEHGYGTINAPANDPYVITVGAMKTMGTYPRNDDLIASYSSKGPTLIDNVVKPDLVAPGNLVVSILANNNVTLNTAQNGVPNDYLGTSGNPTQASNNYFMLSGTSMAAAAVSGAVADLLQVQPNLTPDQVKARLMNTAYKTFPQSSIAVDPVTGLSYTSCYDIFTVGAGYLDLGAALASNYVSAGTSLSPTATFNSSAGTIFLNFDPSSVWAPLGTSGTSSMWGTAVTMGASGIAGSSSIWATESTVGTSSIWGTSGIWGTSSIWGTSGIWGTSSIWATSSIWGTSGNTATSTVASTSTNQMEIAVNGEH